MSDSTTRPADHDLSVRPTIAISRRGAARLQAGHPWVYAGDVSVVQAASGDVVTVVGPRGEPFGQALFSDRSQIALRLLVPSSEPFSPAVLARRLEEAIAYRESLGIDATAYRLVHGEADRLPSLNVDRYGEYLVVQAHSQGMDRLLPEVVDHLQHRLAPRGILARNDARVRELEGLPRRIETLCGDVPSEVEVREGAVRMRVELRTGQKTGLFLDQRENRQAARAYARGRLLDAFSYQGGFALALASRCDGVLALDGSSAATARIRMNAALNGVETIEVRTVNVFDELRALERGGARFETIVLDPPAFAKNRASVPRAIAGYKEVNLRALRLLAAGGHLITCSCSHHIDVPTCLGVLSAAAADSGTQVMVVEQRGQARDHPVLLAVPETAYLKCLILRKLP